jgi:RND superfamily putative drug exporter
MTAPFSITRISALSARRPWITVACWTMILVVAGYLAMGLGDVVSAQNKVTVETESSRADNLIKARLRGGAAPQASEQVIVRSADLTVDDPRFEARVAAVLSGLRALDAVDTATSYYDAKSDALVSADRHTTLIPTVLKGDVKDAETNVKPVMDLVKRADGVDGFEVLTAGDGSIQHAWMQAAERDLSGEFRIGLPAALLVLLVVFGALVAAGVPIALAIGAIVIATGISALLGRAFDLSTFVTNMIAMIGMAVGIDYSLFIIERFREERRRGTPKQEAIAAAAATSGRAVFFAGATVIVAVCGLLIVPDSVFRSLATGAIVVAAVAVLAALTLLPAMLAILGDRVNALRLPFIGRATAERGDDRGFWAAVTRAVVARPAVSVIACVALLGALAVPYFSIKLGEPGISTLPRNVAAFRAYDILDKEFSAGLISPTKIVVDAPNVDDPAVRAAVDRLQGQLRQDKAFGASAVEVSPRRDLAVVSVTIAGDPQSDAAYTALRRLRETYIPSEFDNTAARVSVTGRTALLADYVGMIDRYTPIVFAFVLGLTFLVLLVVFRSIVVPVKALIMNMLSVGAAYGLLVLVFQKGVGNGLFGFRQVDRIDAMMPLFLFAVLFGLSMDYHVFLLSRIRERFDATGDNAGAVAYGLRSTAGIITGAALIMVVVFSGFAFGELATFQEMGFGLAVAVIIDATVVRSVLVPASMVLLGDWNWYLPHWLEWLPKVGVEELPRATPPVRAGSAPVSPREHAPELPRDRREYA